jgi:hypothetical protein
MAFLLGPLLIWTVLDSRAVRSWRRPCPYLGLLVMLLIVGPHFLWAASNGWPTLARANKSATVLPGAQAPRLIQPLNFLFHQGLMLLPLGLIQYRALRPLRSLRVRRPAGFYLAVVVFGPLALFLGSSMIFGLRLRGPWGMPIWTGLGPLLILLLPRPLGAGSRRWVMAGLIVCNLGALALLAGQGLLGAGVLTKPSRIHFAGAQLAAEADRHWRALYQEPIPAVAGDPWLAGNISVYCPDRPPLCWGESPWAQGGQLLLSSSAALRQFRRHGGVLVWDAALNGCELPAAFERWFPNARSPAAIPIGTGSTLVGLAVVPPQDDVSGFSRMVSSPSAATASAERPP